MDGKGIASKVGVVKPNINTQPRGEGLMKVFCDNCQAEIPATDAIEATLDGEIWYFCDLCWRDGDVDEGWDSTERYVWGKNGTKV